MGDDFTATLPRKRMGAGVLLSDPNGRVLLVEPSYKDYWEIPGGAVEADESPYAAVIREVEEELCLPVRPGRLLVTDWVPPRPGRTEGLMLLFDGGILTPEQTARIRLPAEELRGWAWCTEACRQSDGVRCGTRKKWRAEGVARRAAVASRRAGTAVVARSTMRSEKGLHRARSSARAMAPAGSSRGV